MKENAPKLGQIIEGEAQRDAIHIAVAPVEAGHRLTPGMHVGIDAFGRASGRVETRIGVVDPFLKAPIQKGDKFFLFLYPNTITGLRHQWSHPAFSDVQSQPQQKPDAKTEAESWLRDFAEQVDADFNEMIYIAETHCEGSDSKWGDYLCEGGKWEGQGTPKEFWTHYESYTGKKPKGEHEGIFSCSC